MTDSMSSTEQFDLARELLRKARKFCESQKFEEALQLCEAAKKLFQDQGDAVGVSCSLVDISNVYRSQALASYSAISDLNASWGSPLESEYRQYLSDIKWYASGGGILSGL